jgi:pSer/pThr/pTyr-binding forkhead associated (FHA) protein
MSVYRLKGTAGGVINQTFRLSGNLLIGRADDCDIHIDDKRVALHQAEVHISTEGTVQIQDLGSGSGVSLNGEKVSQALLAGGDEIQIGNCRLMLQTPGLRPARVLAGAAVNPQKQHWRWLLAVAFAAALALAFTRGYLDKLLSILGA